MRECSSHFIKTEVVLIFFFFFLLPLIFFFVFYGVENQFFICFQVLFFKHVFKFSSILRSFNSTTYFPALFLKLLLIDFAFSSFSTLYKLAFAFCRQIDYLCYKGLGFRDIHSSSFPRLLFSWNEEVFEFCDVFLILL